MFDPIVKYNEKQIEENIVGSVITHPELYSEVLDVIPNPKFKDATLQKIWECISKLDAENEPIDIVVIATELQDVKATYLVQITSGIASASTLTYFLTTYKKICLKRELTELKNYLELQLSEEKEPDKILSTCEEELYKLSTQETNVSGFKHVSDILKRHESQKSGKVLTGYTALDSKLGGFHNSDLIILAARPGVGKTSLALEFARRVASQEKTVCIFSLEMSFNQLLDRLCALVSPIDLWKIRSGQIRGNELSEAKEIISKLPIYIEDTAHITISKIRTLARRLKRENGLHLIVVDYLQLISPSTRRDNFVHQITEISHDLKGLAKELDVPVLALSQLSRSVEQQNREPRLSDLRDSGSIEQDADVVVFIHRDKDDRQSAKLMIQKHRNGQVGDIEMQFIESRTLFEEQQIQFE